MSQNQPSRRSDELRTTQHGNAVSESFRQQGTPRAIAEHTGSLLSDYYRTVFRHRSLVSICAFVGLLGALLVGLNSEPLYRARTSLNIQNLNGDFLNRRALNPTGSTADETTEENVQTQIKLLQSETLLSRTIERLNREPHAPFFSREDLLSRLERSIHLPTGGQIPYSTVMDKTVHSMVVKPLGMTHLVEITCDSWSASFAAKFCNTLVAEYKAADISTRSEETQKTSDWLNAQVADLRDKVEASQKKLEAATGGNGLVLTQDSTTVGEDRLRQLQAELVRAQADRMQKEGESRAALTASPETVPSVIDSTGYKTYQAKLAELNAQLATLVPPLTEANPKVIHLRAEIRAVEEGMASATTAGQGRMANELSSAKQREKLLSLAYSVQESNVSNDLEKMSRISLLRKEVESEQTMYQDLLQKSKEAGLASAMQTSTAHVVDVAQVPRVPFSPKTGKLTVTGTVLGLVFGLAVAFYRDRQTRLFREPGDVEKILHVQELGVIPSTGGSALSKRYSAGNSSIRVLAASDLTLWGAIGDAGWEDQFSIVAEAYRSATFSLLNADRAVRGKVYVISSPNSCEGKTTVTSNMGVALSKAKLRVLLIDGDLRRPSLHRAFSIPNNFGVRDILRSSATIENAPSDQMYHQTRYHNLHVMPSGTGTEDVVELLHSHRVKGLLNRLSREFDIILIDTPPMLHMADARIFAGLAQGAILVVRSGTTRHQQAAEVRDLFDHDGVPILGSILNDFDAEREGRSDYYESYYRYMQQQSAVLGAKSA